MEAMDPNTTREAKMEALSRAKQHDLDVSAIARETVRLILGEAFAVSRPLVHRLELTLDHSCIIKNPAGCRLFCHGPGRARCVPHPIDRVVDNEPRDNE